MLDKLNITGAIMSGNVARGFKVKKSLGVLLVALAIAVMLTGCGGGATSTDGGASSDNPLVGTWVGADGDTIEFTEDVFYPNPGKESANPYAVSSYRYVVVDDTTLNLTPIVNKNGVEFDDSDKTGTEHYNLDGDMLNLESYGDGYYREGTAEGDKAQATANTEADEDVCVGYRGQVRWAVWDYAMDKDYFVLSEADGSQIDISNAEFKNMTYEQMVAFLVDNDALTIEPATDEHAAGTGGSKGGGTARAVYAPEDNAELKCPSGGTIKMAGWIDYLQGGDTFLFPNLECSIHGELPK